MINDGKMCGGVAAAVNNDEICRSDTMLSNLQALTECLHSIESNLNRISMTMFAVDIGEMVDIEIKDMDTEIKHDRETARGILEKINLLMDRMGLN